MWDISHHHLFLPELEPDELPELREPPDDELPELREPPEE